ncbi:ZIP family zinc transporter/zinc and cadmium transporter [Granulicella aggregans]|jgi:zinc transporter ZupT|uniref:ZIP family zinc transporter/zinc and cadmium transporter n=1 Tax=Granulicella aggregans TaxID=474949 RepID=A0A7W7ZDA9_9BACT|nr:ZIP family metal transporter [Granulicella aggregans]MBB5057805.1 ZIP family zinc transporter/zinc and cadmium transporter [Granulicella aggregans]
MSTFWLSLLLGLGAGLADYLGGVLLVRRSPSAKALRYFVALGSGFMLSAVVLEMLPEGMKANPSWAPALMLIGYCGVHLLEHTLVPHFHFGEETHHHEFISAKTSYSVLLGLATHTFFDGIAIGSGFALSHWLGWVLFFAIFLHKIPEGFTVASVMLAGGRSKTAAMNSALFLGATTVAGVLVISLEPSLVKAGLPLSAGVTFYVAATDLVPEVNREPGIRMALVFFLGVLIFVLLRQFAPA